MLGTIINAATIIAGSLIGIAIHSRLPEKLVNITFQGLGLVTIAIGISMSLKSENMILCVVSIVVGSVLGQWIDIDKHLRRFSENLKKKTQKKSSIKPENDKFTAGFVTASMLFCVGSMAILGAIEDGMGNEPKLLLTKSVMDGISSIALAASFGVCILFSAVPVLLYQGALTLFAGFMMSFMTEPMIAEMTAVGGILLIGLGVNISNIKEINVTNMLPSLVIVVVLAYFF